MDTTSIKSPSLGNAINRGWAIYKNNFVTLFVATLLAGLVTSATCGICSGAMTCGLLGMVLALLRGSEPKPAIGSVFDGFKKFLPSFVVCLVINLVSFVLNAILGLVPIVGLLASIVIVAFIAPAALYWALFLVQDRNVSIGDAIGAVPSLLGKKEFWSFVLVVFVAGLLSAIGIIACGIGLLFTIPIGICIAGAAMDECMGAPDAGDATLEIPA